MASTKIPSILYNVSQTPLTPEQQKLARDNSYTLGSLTKDMNSTAGSWNSLTDTGFYQVQMSPTSVSDPDSPESGRVTALVSTQGTDADRSRYTLQLAMGDSLKYRFFSYRTPAPDPGTWTAWKEVGSEQSATSEKLEKTLTLTASDVEHEYLLLAEINSSGYGVFRLADILTASNTWNDHTEIRYGELTLAHNNSDTEIKQSAYLSDSTHGMTTPGPAIRVTDVLGPSSRNVTLLSSRNLRLYTGTTSSPEYAANLNVQELSFSYSTLSQSASYGKTGLTVTDGTTNAYTSIRAAVGGGIEGVTVSLDGTAGKSIKLGNDGGVAYGKLTHATTSGSVTTTKTVMQRPEQWSIMRQVGTAHAETFMMSTYDRSIGTNFGITLWPHTGTFDANGSPLWTNMTDMFTFKAHSPGTANYALEATLTTFADNITHTTTWSAASGILMDANMTGGHCVCHINPYSQAADSPTITINSPSASTTISAANGIDKWNGKTLVIGSLPSSANQIALF